MPNREGSPYTPNQEKLFTLTRMFANTEASGGGAEPRNNTLLFTPEQKQQAEQEMNTKGVLTPKEKVMETANWVHGLAEGLWGLSTMAIHDLIVNEPSNHNQTPPQQ